MSKMKMDLNIAQSLLDDENYKEGMNEYERACEQAQTVSEEITSALISEIIKQTDTGEKANDFTLSTAILAVAKTLINLSAYMYDTEEDFRNYIQKSRQCVIETIFPSILNPQPCGKCPECKSGKECSNPVIQDEMLQSKVLPIVTGAMIEYDMWNKLMYLYLEKSESSNDTEDKAN